MTVGELISLLLTANSMNDRVYVADYDAANVELESIDYKNNYNWGFVIGKVDMQ